MNDARIHIASFDTKNGLEYNRENYALARDLFNQQRDIKTRFWCERGQFSAQ
jgi:hypothetical protein